MSSRGLYHVVCQPCWKLTSTLPSDANVLISCLSRIIKILIYKKSFQDGALASSAHVEVKVVDVQNSPPVFSGALSGALAEDAPVGTLAMVVKARDADRAQPREVFLELLTSKLIIIVLSSKM